MESGGAADDIVPAADHSQTPAAPATQTPGELLRVEREHRGLSVQQAADELHLDARVVSAIESNNFLMLGAPVYAKGHLRKYASLLGLSPDVVIAHYQMLTDVPAVPVVMPLSTTQPRERISLRVPAWIVAILVIGAVAWWVTAWFLDRRSSAEPQATSGNVAVPMESQPEPNMTTEQLSLQPQSPEPPPSTQPETTPAVTGALSMRLHFTSASWVEVYDASNKRLIFDIGQPGQLRSVSGTPPLTVNLGLASAVTLEVNGRPVAVPRRPGKDATKFVIAADGSVR